MPEILVMKRVVECKYYITGQEAFSLTFPRQHKVGVSSFIFHIITRFQSKTDY